MAWYAIERGQGPPLVLLHGIGMASSAWAPVLDRLAASRRVIAFDLPGFGQTPPLPSSVEPTPAAIVRALVLELVERGIQPPVDIAGNSLGGFVALEAAKAGQARSVVGLSPAGLWRGSAPLWLLLQFKVTRMACRRAPTLTRVAARTRLGRTLGMLVPVAWKGWRVPASEAVEAAENFGRAPAFDRVLRAFAGGFRGGRDIKVPITIAFGQHDLLLLEGQARFGDELPPQTRWLSLPGCGHVPMWDDPEAVARIVLEGTELSSKPLTSSIP